MQQVPTEKHLSRLQEDFSTFTGQMLHRLQGNPPVKSYLRSHMHNGIQLQIPISHPIGYVSYGGKPLPVHLAPGCPVTCWKTLARGRGDNRAFVNPLRLYTRNSGDENPTMKKNWNNHGKQRARFEGQVSLPRMIAWRKKADDTSVLIRGGIGVYRERQEVKTWEGVQAYMTQLVVNEYRYLTVDTPRIQRGDSTSPSASYFYCEAEDGSYAAIVCVGIVYDSSLRECRSWKASDPFNTGLVSTSGYLLSYSPPPPPPPPPPADPDQPQGFWSVAINRCPALSLRKRVVYRRASTTFI